MTGEELEISPRKIPRLGLRYGFVNNRGEPLRFYRGFPKAQSRRLGSSRRPWRFNNGKLIFVKRIFPEIKAKTLALDLFFTLALNLFSVQNFHISKPDFSFEIF
jgi:hypothetical protein